MLCSELIFNSTLIRLEGLDRKLPGSVQGLKNSFARRPYVVLADPVWTWTFPRLDQDPLAEFGAWCAVGCPVVVGGRW